jgi:hypothetical protein
MADSDVTEECLFAIGSLCQLDKNKEYFSSDYASMINIMKTQHDNLGGSLRDLPFNDRFNFIARVSESISN